MSGVRRLTLYLFFILPLSDPLMGQEPLPDVRVTLSSRNRTINQILDEITLQTGYYFTYNASLIQGRQKVKLQVEDIPLGSALDSLLGDGTFAFRVIQRNIVIYQKNTSPPAPFVEEIDRSMLSGMVADSRTGRPLPYATLALYGTSLGSITNQNGEFSFKIPGDLQDPMLVVSYMGYKSLFIPVSYPIEEDLNIRLERETIPLQEVIIRFADPVLLLTEAVSRFRDNYMEDHSTMTAFYREAVKRNDRYMLYSEAVLEVSKGPYSPLSSPDQVRILKGRKITDVSTTDTVLVKLRSGVYTSLSLDIVKTPPDFLLFDFLDRYDLEFTDMMTYEDRLVYVISFQQKPHLTDLLFRGQIYLDQASLAIVAADFEFHPTYIQREPGLFLVSRSPQINIRPMMARYHVDYKELNGKYHISQARAEVELKVRKKRQWISARYGISLEIAITDVIPGQRLRIDPSERVRPTEVLSDVPFEFDPLFWGIYNTIEPEVTLKESLSRIEQNLLEINR